MPLTAKGAEIKANLVKEYGEKRGTEILYSGKNKGTFTGIDTADSQKSYLDSARRGDADGLRSHGDALRARK